MKRLLRLIDAIIDALPPRAYAVLTPLCAATILWFGTRESSHLPRLRWDIPHLDKVMHFTMYAGLTALVYRALHPANPRKPATVRHAWLLMLLIPLAVGIADEFFQGLTATRTRSSADLLADALGALTACLAALTLRHLAAKPTS